MITDESNADKLQGSLKLLQSKTIQDNSVHCKMLKIAYQRKDKHLTQKIDNQLHVHDHEITAA